MEYSSVQKGLRDIRKRATVDTNLISDDILSTGCESIPISWKLEAAESELLISAIVYTRSSDAVGSATLSITWSFKELRKGSQVKRNKRGDDSWWTHEPDPQETQRKIGNVLAAHKEYEKALCILEPLVRQGDPEAAVSVFCIYLKQENFPKALASIRLASLADAQVLDLHGYVAYSAGAHEEAHPLLLPRALQGDSLAAGWVGQMYRNGQGIDQDYAQALKFLRLASRSDKRWSLDYAMCLWEAGEYTDALPHLEALAGEGVLRAVRVLGLMYERGDGVGKDYGSARYWYLEGKRLDPSNEVWDTSLIRISGRSTASRLEGRSTLRDDIASGRRSSRSDWNRRLMEDWQRKQAASNTKSMAQGMGFPFF